jgi:hypothetical protein
MKKTRGMGGRRYKNEERERERGKKSNVILISGQIIYPLVPQLC